jgi:hypothetical protein
MQMLDGSLQQVYDDGGNPRPTYPHSLTISPAVRACGPIGGVDEDGLAPRRQRGNSCYFFLVLSLLVRVAQLGAILCAQRPGSVPKMDVRAACFVDVAEDVQAGAEGTDSGGEIEAPNALVVVGQIEDVLRRAVGEAVSRWQLMGSQWFS